MKEFIVAFQTPITLIILFSIAWSLVRYWDKKHHREMSNRHPKAK